MISFDCPSRWRRRRGLPAEASGRHASRLSCQSEPLRCAATIRLISSTVSAPGRRLEGVSTSAALTLAPVRRGLGEGWPARRSFSSEVEKRRLVRKGGLEPRRSCLVARRHSGRVCLEPDGADGPLPEAHEGAGAEERFVASDQTKTPSSWSADGRSVAYQSNESGRDEVYVRPFVPPSPQASASSAGLTPRGPRAPPTNDRRDCRSGWLASRTGCRRVGRTARREGSRRRSF